MSCTLEKCTRESENGFCAEHHSAHMNIEQSFVKWKKAYGTKYSKRQYFLELINNKDMPTGKWIKEIAEYLIEKG